MNNVLEYKGFSGTVEFSANDNLLFGKVIGINSLLSYEGKSISELKADFEGAIDDYLEICEERGIEPEKEYKGSFNIRISPDLHKHLATISASKGNTLNATVEQAIKQYVETV